MIKLYWVEKLRELMSDEDLSDYEVIRDFEIWCKKEEDAINKRWKNETLSY